MFNDHMLKRRSKNYCLIPGHIAQDSGRHRLEAGQNASVLSMADGLLIPPQ